MQTPEAVLVIDVPMDTTAEEAAALLNEPLQRNYYLTSVLGWSEVPGVGARAFFKLRVKTPGTVCHSMTQAAIVADATEQIAEARAVEFIRDNPTMSIRGLRSALEASGFKRGHSWVHVKRHEIERAQR